MRYADGPTVEAEVLIAAPVERVWEIVTDIHMPARFSSELQETTWLEGATQAAPGARFQGRNQHPAAGEWETTCTVNVFEPGQAFGWVVNAEDPAAEWRFDLEPTGDHVRLRQSTRLGPGFSGLSMAIAARPDKEERIIERRLEEHRANMLATLEGVKALAEESAS